MKNEEKTLARHEPSELGTVADLRGGVKPYYYKQEQSWRLN